METVSWNETCESPDTTRTLLKTPLSKQNSNSNEFSTFKNLRSSWIKMISSELFLFACPDWNLIVELLCWQFKLRLCETSRDSWKRNTWKRLCNSTFNTEISFCASLHEIRFECFHCERNFQSTPLSLSLSKFTDDVIAVFRELDVKFMNCFFARASYVLESFIEFDEEIVLRLMRSRAGCELKHSTPRDQQQPLSLV